MYVAGKKEALNGVVGFTPNGYMFGPFTANGLNRIETSNSEKNKRLGNLLNANFVRKK